MINKLDPQVRRFTRSLEADVELQRDSLERKGKTPLETEFTRGYIKALRKILTAINGDPDNDETGRSGSS